MPRSVAKIYLDNYYLQEIEKNIKLILNYSKIELIDLFNHSNLYSHTKQDFTERVIILIDFI